MLGKFDTMAMGPALPGNDIDDWLYSTFYPSSRRTAATWPTPS
jgi:hypothetical protein